METAFIYALNDPETGECRYVGKTDRPKTRLSTHVAASKNKDYHVSRWIRSLATRGMKPIFEILDEVPRDQWKFWERVWIKTSREIGMNLTNETDGGDGFESGDKNPMFGKTGAQSPTFGRKHPPAELEKMRISQLGKKLSPEQLIVWSAVKKGIKHSPEHRAKRRTKRKSSSSVFHGVCWVTRKKKWRARLEALTSYHLGYFSNEIDAAKAYDAAAKKYCGEFAILNFPNK